uniref:Uncharacterized protein n=1 Tax=Globisporangium ultimum (strain ATCC 200006 / CBS 805.95 / DAOM BR144) TaxID=431595 RepID=K3WNJ1_GLOUD
MRFSDANAALLGPALGINTVLCYLDLHGNDIRNDAAIAIATHGLAHNRHLTYLNLADNAIGSPGAIALFNCLATQNQTLETLILCNNNALNDVMPAFLATWQSNATVLRVDLRGNLIHSDHLEAIAAAVQERSAASVEPKLRLFLARRRFSATAAQGLLSR